ncbi:hypothetical protein GP486_005816 [Trichoglossum hirsutum]|uniref:Uncharacterized protein n=1 Tax=Trichoglossum hirsutum TaxID=265104 RepID=A0A9P8L8I7_9PEZI|nr:hypothetical protein GP486_005816 [Trichoglossum hirsutum]
MSSILRGDDDTPKKRSTTFANFVSMKVYLLAPVSMREEVLIPSPLLLTVHDRVNAIPPSNRLKSTSTTSIPFGLEEKTFFRATRFSPLAPLVRGP